RGPAARTRRDRAWRRSRRARGCSRSRHGGGRGAPPAAWGGRSRGARGRAAAARRRRGTRAARCGAAGRARRRTSGGSEPVRGARTPAGRHPDRRPAGAGPAVPAVRRPRWRGARAPSGLLALARAILRVVVLRGVVLLRLGEQALQGGEAGIDHLVVVVRVVLHAEAALAAQAGAVLAAQGPLVGLHRQGVADQRPEVHLVGLEEGGVVLLVGLDLLGVHEQLVEAGGDVLVDGVEAA